MRGRGLTVRGKGKDMTFRTQGGLHGQLAGDTLGRLVEFQIPEQMP